MITFTLNDEQERLLREWQAGHECKYRSSDGRRNVGTFGGTDTFTFIPTTVEEVVMVECACGEKIDLSLEHIFFQKLRQRKEKDQP